MSFVAVGGGTRVTPPSIYPLSVSSRWVNKSGSVPFYMNGDAPWSLMVQTTRDEVAFYLADRQAKGVNLLMINLIEHQFTDQTPNWRNKYGQDPFTGTVSVNNPDFTTPNEYYWAHVDYVLRLCDFYGMTVLAAPCYMGFQQGVEGWASVILANGSTNMTTYGTFIGSRYASFKNIIWLMGGDCGPNDAVGDLTTHVNNLANAIKAADSNHLMSAHPGPGNTSASTGQYNQSWLDIVACYPNANTDLSTIVKTGYQLAAAKPVFMIEGQYGNEHAMTDNTLRIQMYQSVLGGAIGHIYGQDPTWYFGTNAGTSAHSSGFADATGVDWHNILSNYGANFLIYVQRLQAARPLSTLTPDYNHVVVTAGFGTLGATSYAPVAANSNILVAYTNGVALTVDKSQFTSATFNVNWYNVRDGSTTAGTATAFGSGSQVFTPPTTGAGNDWVLLCDNPSLGLANPANGSGGVSGAVWRGNEPAGMTLVSDMPFTTLNSNGWTPNDLGGLSVSTDATAPQSPSNVCQFFYNGPPSAFAGGFPPGSLDSASVNANEIYFCTYVKVSSNWYGHPSHNNKIYHGWFGGSNRVVLELHGIGTDPLYPGFDYQNITGGTAGPFDSPTPIVRGQWHLYECHLVANSANASDHVAKLWLDGNLVCTVTGIQLTAAANTWDFLQISPIWGGTGSTVPADQWMWIDHVYLSKK